MEFSNLHKTMLVSGTIFGWLFPILYRFFVYIYIYIYIHTHTHTYIYIYIYIYIGFGNFT